MCFEGGPTATARSSRSATRSACPPARPACPPVRPLIRPVRPVLLARPACTVSSSRRPTRSARSARPLARADSGATKKIMVEVVKNAVLKKNEVPKNTGAVKQQTAMKAATTKGGKAKSKGKAKGKGKAHKVRKPKPAKWLKERPYGCPKCRNSSGCTPSCWRYKTKPTL